MSKIDLDALDEAYGDSEIGQVPALVTWAIKARVGPRSTSCRKRRTTLRLSSVPKNCSIGSRRIEARQPLESDGGEMTDLPRKATYYVRDRLAEKGTELTPQEVEDARRSGYATIRKGLRAKGYDVPDRDLELLVWTV